MGISQIPVTGLKQYVQTFTSSSTWACPVGTNAVDLLLVGGGGAGGSGVGGTNGNATFCGIGGGGGGGQVVKQTIQVTPGTTYTVTVAAGGSSASTPASNQTVSTAYSGDGGVTSFGLSSTLAQGFSYNGELTEFLPAWPSAPEFNTKYYGWFHKTDTSSTLTTPPAYNAANGSFQLYPWNTYKSTNLVSGAGYPSYGTEYICYSTAGGSNTRYNDLCSWVAVSPSTAYTVSFWTAAANGTANASTSAIRIEWYQSFEGTFISASNSTSWTNDSVSTSWTQKTFTATSPANATYALVRFQTKFASTAGDVAYSTFQIEQGSSFTSFKTVANTAGATFDGQKLVNITAGALAAGGGAGTSATSNTTSNYYALGGFGGGGGVTATGNLTASSVSYYHFGGHGAGFESAIPPKTDGTLTNTAQGPVAYRTTFSDIFFGMPTSWSRSNHGQSFSLGSSQNFPWMNLGSSGKASPEGYGAGGLGGIYTQYNSTIGSKIGWSIPVGFNYGAPGMVLATYGVNSPGKPGSANTGSGGGGAVGMLNSGTVARGGNGGSGIVKITYWGI